MEQKVDFGKAEFRVEFQVEFELFCSHHTSCSVIYREIVTRSNVKIQNRGPEQEIPAVTCVRLIAQKHRY